MALNAVNTGTPSVLSHILEISTHMASMRAVDPLLHYVVQESMTLFDADFGCLALVDRNQSPRFRVILSSDPAHNDPEVRFSILEEVTHSGQARLANDSLPVKNGGAPMLEARSVMCVPLRTAGQVLGALYLSAEAPCIPFDEHHLTYVQLFANQAAISIENALLNENLEARIVSRTAELEAALNQLRTSETERQHMAQRVMHQHLEAERGKVLSNFISGASHQFRTPLSVISVKADLLSRFIPEELSTRHLDPIHRQVDIMSQLLETLVKMAQLDTIESLPLTSLDLNDTVEQAFSALEHMASERGQTYQILLSSTPLMVQANHQELLYAVMCLLRNAIQFTPQGGRVYVEAFYENKCAVIRIQDNGVGIMPEEMPKIFSRFYRYDKAGTTRGFGLGLSIARRIIELHHGHIQVNSAVDAGSEFRIVLPLNGHQFNGQ